MSASTRVYKVTGADGKPRYIDCATRAQAVQHVYAPVVEGPLTGSQVRLLMKEEPDAIEVLTRGVA